MKLWDYQTGRCLQTFVGHQDKIFGVACSPNSQLIAGASTDGTVKLWDINSGKCLKTLTGHTHLVSSVAYSPDGKTIISGSQDQTVRIWDTKTGECVQILRSARIYENMNITGVTGLTEAQKMTLKALGAVEQEEKILAANPNAAGRK